MPELPEVETIRRDLTERIVDKKIIGVDIFFEKAVKNNKDYFVDTLRGRAISSINRRGKLLVFCINDKLFLLVHLRMTGQLIYQKDGRFVGGGHSQRALEKELPGKHTLVRIRFADKAVLYYNDLRRFGYLRLADAEELSLELLKFGPEPLSPGFTTEYLSGVFNKRKIPVKNLLLNQKVVAGIGNIYADEALFMARILPTTIAGQINIKALRVLVKSIKKIIAKAIEHRGTTFSDYRDADGGAGGYAKLLKVYGRGGQTCLSCGNPLKKIKLGGRGTVYCAHCQK